MRCALDQEHLTKPTDHQRVKPNDNWKIPRFLSGEAMDRLCFFNEKEQYLFPYWLLQINNVC